MTVFLRRAHNRTDNFAMARQPQPAPFDGALVINKPQGKTSHDIVDAVRHLAGFRQIGHLGTLDPLATGVLVLLLGKATRLVRFLCGPAKTLQRGIPFRICDQYLRFGRDRYGAGDFACVGSRTDRTVGRGIRGTIRADAANFFRKENSWPTRVRTGAQESGCGVEARERGSVRIPVDGIDGRGGALFDRMFFGDVYSISGARHGPEIGLRSAPERNLQDGGRGIFLGPGD